MPTHETLERFIARVESNEHAKAIAEFYNEDASMQENQSEPRKGRAGLIDREQSFLAKLKSLTSQCIRPVFVNGDRVLIHWRFHFVLFDGKTIDIEEIASQRWQGEQIAEEQFFYDPAQREPK